MPLSNSETKLRRKRSHLQLEVEIEQLHLDTANPRLPEEIQGAKEKEILKYLFEHFDLEEIAEPMGLNGYFDEEPLVIVPKDLPISIQSKQAEATDEYLAYINKNTTQFIVVEGNRRLATAMILRDAALRNSLRIHSWPNLSDEIQKDLEILPTIVYKTRKEVLPYLGVRHITGNKKWESYAKARYIADMVHQGHTIEEIMQQVGDKAQSVRKNAIAYHMLRQANEELDWNINEAKKMFSLLLLATGQKNIRRYLGWLKVDDATNEQKSVPLKDISLDSPIPATHINNLRDILSWLYGDNKKHRPVINESRDITNYLSEVVASPEAIEYLKAKRDLKEAYELTDGEESMLKKLLKNVNIKLEKALGVVHRHKTPDIIDEAEKCNETASQVLKSVKG